MMDKSLGGTLAPDYVEAFLRHRAADEAHTRRWTERLIATGAFRAGARLLDLGCGVGRFTAPLGELGRVTCGVDKDPNMLAQARRNVPMSVPAIWLRADAAATGLAGEQFDAALVSMLLEHVEDRDRVFQELSRLLVGSGEIVIRTMLPGDIEKTWWYEFFPAAALIERGRTPSIEALGRMAERAGFEITATRTFVDDDAGDTSEAFYQRIAARSYEALRRIPDAAFDAGLRRLSSAIATDAVRNRRAASMVHMRKVR